MEKKIATEVKINNNDFKLKIGSMDKQHPNVVYVEGGTFITPTINKDSYKTDVREMNINFDRSVKRVCCDYTYKGKQVFKDDLILNFEAADDRMKFGKKTYLYFQVFLKQRNEFNFKEISSIMQSGFIDNIVKNFTDVINNKQFSYSKTKS